MCLILKKNWKIQTTRRDRTVYKLFLKAQGNLYSPIMDEEYIMNRRKNVPKFGTDGCSVEEGLHAYTTLQRARKQVSPNRYIFKCTIPAGTKFILGEHQEIVSLCLRVFEEVV